MNEMILVVFLATLGLLLGSFAGATVWRLRARQLQEDKEAGETVDAKEFKRLKKIAASSVRSDRSQCLHCGHQLAWYDLVPLVSWLQLKGKCRYCHRSIGTFEPVVELGTALFFVISYIAWPTQLQSTLDIVLFVSWLVAGVGLIILFIYDARWYLLPDKVMFPLLGLALATAILRVITAPDQVNALISVIAGCIVLSGLYLALYLISKGAWVGFGDIKLGLVLALLLANWQLALLALFLANIIGCLVVLPAMAFKHLSRYSHVPFGPMLIGGFWIAGLFGSAIISWYLQISFSFL